MLNCRIKYPTASSISNLQISSRLYRSLSPDLTDVGTVGWEALLQELLLLISLTRFCPEGLLAAVFLQAGRDFLYGAAEGGRGGTRPADRHAHRRQQHVDQGEAVDTTLS